MLVPNTILQNRYRIIRKLAAGGMGAVYEAIDQRLNAVVAIKETSVQTDELRRAFEREARLLANIRHPSLPVVIDHFFEGNGQFLVMDFVPGDDLKEILARQQTAFSTSEILTFANELLQLLEYLHAKQPPVIHRDIKPANIKLGRGGHVFLLDFGLAKGSVGQMTTVTNTGSIFGYTASYAPLEQMHGVGTDARSDIYSLGATLYHLITGVAPCDARIRWSTIEDGKDDPLTEPYKISPAVGSAISQVIVKAMAMSQRNRFASAGEMRQVLGDMRCNEEKEGPVPGTIDDNEETRGLEPGRLGSAGSTKELQFEYWTELNRVLRSTNSVARLNPPSAYFEITGFIGHPKVKLFAAANVRDGKVCVGIRIFDRKDIYSALEERKKSIEEGIGDREAQEKLVWSPKKNYQSISEISLCNHHANIAWRERWDEYLDWHRRNLEMFYRAFDQEVRKFKDSIGSIKQVRAASPSKDSALVRRFWDGFQSRLTQYPELIQLNKPHIPAGGGSGSWRRKALGHGFNLAAQLNPGRNSVDVNITVGSKQYAAFEALYSQRPEIESEISSEVEWRLKPSGESWVVVRRDFHLNDAKEWDPTYEWLLEQLGVFERVFILRITSLNNLMEEGDSLNSDLNSADQTGDLTRLLNSVGKSTFVRYYYEFADRSLSNREIVEILPKEYSSNSRNSKVSCAKRIFREGKQIEALEIIAEARNVSDETRRRAGELLSQISAPSSESVTSDVDALHRVMIDGKKRQFWIVLWGDPARRLLEETQIFDQPTYDQGFPVNPSGIQTGDILFVHRIGNSKISFVAEALTTARKSTSNEIDREEWRKRWIWSVKTRNLTPEYGLQWSVSGQRTFDLLGRYNSLNPDNEVSISGIKFGRHVRIPQAFAEFLINEIQQVVTDAS